MQHFLPFWIGYKVCKVCAMHLYAASSDAVAVQPALLTINAAQ